ncbi:response regulator [Oculatella sp. LEGE 06141]|uniref:response regulator n=1 Tax=Oculatella sp. LEGE 06141 TaxID=1828648 RepID=UPI00187FF940|nr:response regulator [Oculatella sp. LEGE 06141]MBE9181887.1 response regulator [Oculatella sp. LEGE 06141]
MTISASYCFAFQTQELPQKLVQLTKETLTGYWLCTFSSCKTNPIETWYLTVFQGRVVCSGTQPLSCDGLLKLFRRYSSHLRRDTVKQAVQDLEKQFSVDHRDTHPALLRKLLVSLHQQKLISAEEMRRALRLQLLSDFDQYLFDTAGDAQFLPVSPLDLQVPIVGFGVEELLTEAIERQTSWHSLQSHIPSMDHIPSLNMKVMDHINLTTAQRQRLESLVSDNQPLSEIAVTLAQDPLDIAKVFTKLIRQGLVALEPPARTETPTVFVVDDSPLLLKQFERLVSGWGYSVRSFENPVVALQTLTCSNPGIIFLDVNMPVINGFVLVKQIRRQPELASVPLIILTAEKTLSNNWRARWSGCKFLSKPLTPEEVPQFQLELQMILTELVPLHKQQQADKAVQPFERSYRLGDNLA